MKPKPPSGLVPTVTLISGYRGLAESLIDSLYKAQHQLSVLVRNESAIAGLQKQYPEALFCFGDVSSKESCTKWVNQTLIKFGRIDCLINNAAIGGPGGKLHEINFKDFEETLLVNLTAPIFLTQLVLPSFLEQGMGVVINLSGGGAAIPRPHFAAYATSKCGLARFTESIALEYPQLRFYSIAPGSLKTPMIEAVAKIGRDKIGPEYDEAMRRIQHGGDDPAMAINLVQWLCEEKPQNLNGKLITAKWDNYKNPPWPKEGIPFWTLRRVDGVLVENLKTKLET